MNHCHLCGSEVKGNVRPEHEVAIICGRCTAGQAEYVKNHPDEYPIPEPVKKPRLRISKKDMKVLADKRKAAKQTLADC